MQWPTRSYEIGGLDGMWHKSKFWIIRYIWWGLLRMHKACAFCLFLVKWVYVFIFNDSQSCSAGAWEYGACLLVTLGWLWIFDDATGSLSMFGPTTFVHGIASIYMVGNWQQDMRFLLLLWVCVCAFNGRIQNLCGQINPLKPSVVPLPRGNWSHKGLRFESWSSGLRTEVV